MQASHSSLKASLRSTTPPLDSSSEDLDLCIEYDLEDLENIDAPRKPHFLDYDYVPPPGFDESTSENIKTQTNKSGEHVIMDKVYERDGEISDCVLATKSSRKRETFGISSLPTNTDKITVSNPTSSFSTQIFLPENENINTGTRRKKHFLEETAMVSPLYCREREREHRSLDRNFERLGENVNLKYERKLSLDRDGPPTFAIPKFIDRDVSPVYHRGTWPTDKPNDIHSIYTSVPISSDLSKLGPKVECVYSLLSMLGSNDSNNMSIKFLELSKSPETCVALRRSGCIPLLVQMIHSDSDEYTKKRASVALHNVVHCHPDDKFGRREAKVLRLIEQIMEYNDFLKNVLKTGESVSDDLERHPSQAIYSLMKISFDEDHRHAMCQLGALPAIANLVYLDHAAHGSKSDESRCITLRRYSGMAFTNLTFGDGNNKALLCSNKNFMKSLVDQLDSSPEELIQVTAGVLRNLSWRADNNVKLILSEIGTVTALTKAAMKNRNENTLKSILSALWNLTAHCSMNKAELCNVEGALAFLADMLMFEAPGKNLTIVENAGGILRNVSSHIAVREDYRKILRQRNCLGILLQQLKSESLTVVSNACGTLWNLSARCPEDQKFLCDNGAVPMLRSLVHSKHKMISNGSNAALKNLLNFKPTGLNTNILDPIAKSMNLKELPSLNVRKQRALAEDLDQNLSETCENIDVVTPPKEEQNVQDFCNLDTNFHHKTKTYLARNPNVTKSDSKDSITSLKSNSTDKSIGCLEEKPLQSTSKKFAQCATKSEDDTNFKYPNEPGECDQLTDFSAKYNRESSVRTKILNRESSNNRKKEETATYTVVYQETDLDQITDYSLLYAEKHSESDDKHNANSRSYGNEIILTLEDTVKCYETEGTPYIISNATSMSDLRNNKENDKLVSNDKPKIKNIDTFETSGINTPEKPVKYCDEGTPGSFSRRDSISSIDDTSSSRNDKITKVFLKNEITNSIPVDIPEIDEVDVNDTTSILATTPGGTSVSKNVTFVEFEQETPLMFSRHSSVESLSSAEPDCVDDQSSVVSEFSRLASGIISPSELPDSPTQSMPQTPRTTESTNFVRNTIAVPPPLRSVFEDEVNTFGIEHTPAQFSCATSLSNLSLDDEPKISADSLLKDMRLVTHPSEELEDKLEPSNQPVGSNSSEDINSNEENAKVNETKNKDDTQDDSDGDDGDDHILFETCINIGMNRGARSKDTHPTTHNNFNSNDDTIKFCTEDTPAVLSKACSNTNLSILSMETNKADLSDDSSNGSDSGNAILFEECIRDGMPPSKEFNDKLYKENPIVMMRSGGSILPSYIFNKDEVNKFNVEDSPCNFSTMSALSNLTIESDAPNGLGQSQRAQLKNIVKNGKKEPLKVNRIMDEDTSSSISNDSEEDKYLFNQALTAGLQSKPKYSSAALVQSTPQLQITKLNQASSSAMNTNPSIDVKNKQYRDHVNDANDSISSVDSSESNDNQQNLLFQQCIQSGINTKSSKSSNEILEPKSSTPKKSYLPMYKTPPVFERDRVKDREKKDEQLLLECINTGMTKSIRNETYNQIKSPVRSITLNSQKQTVPTSVDVLPNPKNVPSTSVVVLDMKSAPSTATDVGKESLDGTKESKEDQYQHNTILKMQNGYKNNSHILTDKPILEASTASINLFLNNSDNILDRSNEYPALKLSNIDFTENSSLYNSSMEMDLSNEFLIETTESVNLVSKIDKHKDPDLMLKSVERLTQELVSTAEYLRTNASNNDDECSVQHDKKSSSNNTWSDDTCPNDISFPSISMTVPMVGSMNEDDTTISDINLPKKMIFEESTPTNEICPFITPNFHISNDILREASLETTLTYDIPKINESSNDFDSLEPDSNTLTTFYLDKKADPEISFDVGGEVQQPFLQNPTFSYMMTNSIIEREAYKIVDCLRSFPQMHDSVTSLDLDAIRPPSAMDNLSISGYVDIPHSPQLSRTRKKSLPAGLIARRALGHLQTGGSLESVNSSCNLDNIKPPSLMDELLDSMISVASITSEIADSNLDGTSQYDTALSDIEDTITLQSCLDIPNDSTPIPSDFSSAESTPKKSRNSKRSLTPKQRRQLAKDRFRTYTIAADMVLKEKQEENRVLTETDDTDVEEEIIKIEIDETRQKLTPRQKRIENRSRFETQILETSGLGSSSSLEGQYNGSAETVYSINNQERYRTPTINTSTYDNFSDMDKNSSFDLNDDDDPSLRELTERFKYIQGNINITSTTTTKTTTIAELVNYNNFENDIKSSKYIQSSEPESYDPNCGSDNSVEFRTYTKPVSRIVKPNEKQIETPPSPEIKTIRGGKKTAYISPYRRTNTLNDSRTSPKHNTSVNNSRSNIAQKGNDVKRVVKTSAVSNLIPKKQTIESKTHFVINKTNLSTKINSIKAKTNIKKIVNQKPSNLKQTEQKPIPLERQGTFVKDEPSLTDVPIVNSVPASPSRIPKLPVKISTQNNTNSTKIGTPKSPAKTFMSKLKNPIQKSTSMDADKILTAQKKTPTSSKITSPSSSNEVISSKRRSLGVFKSPSVPSVPVRSNSNTSMKNNNIAKKPTPIVSPPSRSNSKNNITSKIAGLWKKNDLSGKKTNDENKLIRSSTFDTTENGKIDDSKNKKSTKITTTSRLSQIASKYRNTQQEPSTSNNISKNNYKKSTSANNIKNVVLHNDVDENNVNAKRISRIGSFVNGESGRGTKVPE